MTIPVLKITEACKSYGRGTAHVVPALDSLSLTVQQREFVTIIGSNGSGKSTLLNAIAGNVLLDSGTIEISGREVQGLPEHRRAQSVARVFQNPTDGLACHLTLRENIVLHLNKHRQPSLRSAYRKSSGVDATVAALATLRLGLEQRLDQSVGSLSFGQMQAFSVQLATVDLPAILLLDEHCSSLDPQTSEMVMSLTERRIREGNLTALMVTHSIRLALAHGDILIIMHAGRIVLRIDSDRKRRMSERDLLTEFRRQLPRASLGAKALLDPA
jgi:putative ABC transport system ATP-binding protein